MHASRGVVYYRVAMECLSENSYTPHMQHGIHTTRLYNKSVQHPNRKISGKEKLDLIEVIKGGTYIRIGLGFNLYPLKKQTR